MVAWPSVLGISKFVSNRPTILSQNTQYGIFPTLSNEHHRKNPCDTSSNEFLAQIFDMIQQFYDSCFSSPTVWSYILYVTQFYFIGNQNSVEGLIECQGLRAPHRGSAVIWNGRWIFTCFGSKLNVRRERCQMRPFSCWLTLSPPILWISFTLYSTHSHFNRNYYRNIKVKWRGS